MTRFMNHSRVPIEDLQELTFTPHRCGNNRPKTPLIPHSFHRTAITPPHASFTPDHLLYTQPSTSPSLHQSSHSNGEPFNWTPQYIDQVTPVIFGG